MDIYGERSVTARNKTCADQVPFHGQHIILAIMRGLHQPAEIAHYWARRNLDDQTAHGGLRRGQALLWDADRYAARIDIDSHDNYGVRYLNIIFQEILTVGGKSGYGILFATHRSSASMMIARRHYHMRSKYAPHTDTRNRSPRNGPKRSARLAGSMNTQTV